jgi:hypothetical protein
LNLLCQSVIEATIATLIQFVKWSGRPATGHRRRVAARWRPYVGRDPTGQSTTCSKVPRGRRSTPSLTPFPFSIPLCAPSGTEAAAVAASSAFAARTRHRTTGRFTTATAPQPPPAPCRPPYWSNRARVRAHFCFRHREASPAFVRATAHRGQHRTVHLLFS